MIEEEKIRVQEFVDKLSETIKNQNFEGTEEEIKVQQIMFLADYIKEHLDYSFRSIEDPKTFRRDFEKISFLEGIGTCGNISAIAKEVLNKVGIETDYVWGHIGEVGHRWNKVHIGEMDFMIDFTLDLVQSKNYKESKGLLPQKSEEGFLFFDKLLPNQTMGGFKLERTKNGSLGHVDDRDKLGNLQNTTKDPRSIIPNLSTLPKEYVESIIHQNLTNMHI